LSYTQHKVQIRRGNAKHRPWRAYQKKIFNALVFRVFNKAFIVQRVSAWDERKRQKMEETKRKEMIED
jgi:hypothetical protein